MDNSDVNISQAAASEIGTFGGEEIIQPNQCTYCKATFGYKISHLRKNKKCTEFYVNMYKESTKYRDYWEKYKDEFTFLSKIFKIEYMKERRNDLDKKERDNLRRKELRQTKKLNVNVKNCLSNYFNTIEVALSKECYYCHGLRSPEEVEVLEEMYGNVICKLCKDIEKSLSPHINLLDELQHVLKENRYTENSILGIYDIVENRTRHIVYYPRFEKGENTMLDGDYDKKNVCVVIPHIVFHEKKIKKVSPSEAKTLL